MIRQSWVRTNGGSNLFTYLMLGHRMRWFYTTNKKIRSEGSVVPTMNIVQFKMQLVADLVGSSITDPFDTSCEHVHEHVAVPIEGGGCSRCVYCALMSEVCKTGTSARIVVFLYVPW